VGEANVNRNSPAIMASEDFSFMMEARPGARINIGNGADSVPVHNAMFDFNDESLPDGAGVLATLVELKLPKGGA
jgi:hippurate hydrolase